MIPTSSQRNTLSLSAVLGGFNEATLPLAYVEREAVERAFKTGLDTQSHILVCGSPGVGKSALIRNNVSWSDVIFIECLKEQRAPDVYRSILSEAGARIKTETRLSKERRLVATLKFFSAGAEGDFEHGTESTETEVTVDLGNIGDVVRILQSHKDNRSYVVLNDFHLLARSVQRRIVNSLQYIYERTNFRFIIVGNWVSQGYLTDLNSLVPSFSASVNVPAWSREELTSVLSRVEQLLNVSFSPQVRDILISNSAGSIREFTDYCHGLLSTEGVAVTQATRKEITNVGQLNAVSDERTERPYARYADLLSSYLSVKLLTIDGADVAGFIESVGGDLLASGDSAGGEKEEGAGKFSFDELRQALDDTVQIFNRPKSIKQSLRRALIDALVTRIRESGEIQVQISLAAIGSGRDADIKLDIPPAEAERLLRKAVRRLVRVQAQYGFNPKLLAYDPRGKALVLVEPKFRAFLRSVGSNIDMYQGATYKSIDQIPHWRRTPWHDAMRRAASSRRLAAA